MGRMQTLISRHLHELSTEDQELFREHCTVLASGYPGDQRTQQWLDMLGTHLSTYPTTIRRSWLTIQKTLLAKRTAPGKKGPNSHLTFIHPKEVGKTTEKL